VRITKERKEKKPSKMEFNETPPRALIQYLKPFLKEFVLHNYIARWQDVRFKGAMNILSLMI
jgi:hypothetical protein